MNFSVETFILLGTFILTLFGILVIGFVIYYERRQFRLELRQKEEKQIVDLEFQRKLLENSMEVQEIERRRLAKDLHDEVGALLSLLKMGNTQLLKKNGEISDIEAYALNNQELIDETISIVRSISKDLVPQTLEKFGLFNAIEEFINKTEKNSKIKFIFTTSNFNDEIRFSGNIELALYRIIQEITNNVLKHAAASEISLQISYYLDKLFLSFSDNGVGFDLNEVINNPKTGLGLRNIESRLSIIKGTFKLITNINKGVLYEIEINDCHEKN